MTAKIIATEHALADPEVALRYLARRKQRASMNALESIIDAHLWRKSTPIRLLREQRWAELASMLGSAYTYHADALFQTLQDSGRPKLHPAENWAYHRRCSILRALADIAHARSSSN